MIKECNVIMQNSHVAVAVFDGLKIQVPNSDVVDRGVYIRLENGSYSIATKDEFTKEQVKEVAKNKTSKKNEEINKNSELSDRE